MQYQEQIINGILHWRGAPDSEWRAMTAAQLTTIVMELRQHPALVTPPALSPSYVVTCKAGHIFLEEK